MQYCSADCGMQNIYLWVVLCIQVATIDKANKKKCTIPDSCRSLMEQTQYIGQQKYYEYVKQARFQFLPQVHDASPRVATQALAHDVPLLMNAHLHGGWKYLNQDTGEFFHDMSDFRPALERILKGTRTPHHYDPRKWVTENYGDIKSGRRLCDWVRKHFEPEFVKLPPGTTRLQI